MNITIDWLKEKAACAEGIAWFKAQEKTEAVAVLKALIEEGQLDWANWTIVRVMTRPQYLAYAIYAAEQVIDIFEKKYPNDKRPRKAIEAAKAVLENDTTETRAAARDAAGAVGAAAGAVGAVGAAAEAAAWDAWAAAWDAWAAAEAAARDAWAAAWDAWAAAWAARDAAGAARDAGVDMKKKILRYGISLLEEREAGK